MEDKKTYYKRADDEYQPYVYDIKQNDFVLDEMEQKKRNILVQKVAYNDQFGVSNDDILKKKFDS